MWNSTPLLSKGNTKSVRSVTVAELGLGSTRYAAIAARSSSSSAASPPRRFFLPPRGGTSPPITRFNRLVSTKRSRSDRRWARTSARRARAAARRSSSAIRCSSPIADVVFSAVEAGESG